MSALHFGNEGQSLEPFVHSRGGTCDGRGRLGGASRDGMRAAEGQSLELLVHRGAR